MKAKYIAIAAALMLGVISASAQTPVIIKFSHVVTNDTPKGQGALKFKELAEARSNGRVKVEVYPNSQLFKDKEELEALQLGVVQMLAPSLSKFGPLGAKEFEVFDLPFIFDSVAELHRVLDGATGAMLMKNLEPKGIIGLAFWDNGFKVMTANKALRRVDDFKGLKLRIQSSKVLEAQMRSIGANPQVMAFSEVYQAMQTGVVDGSENTPSNIYTQRHHEVQKFLTLSDHGYIGYAVVTNKKFWDGLPADLRTILEGAMGDATKFTNDHAQADNEAALKKIAESGKLQVIQMTPQERAEWKRAMTKSHRQMEDRIGKELILSIYKETGYKPD
ncbi:MAG: DctP family TRAP transporter solute-binding subunit [Rhodocyclaceae bacterium]|nr:MAG: DctP family TRAP transporter solute-binding subunit [Rhodocyclaceae bacterium]